MVTDEFDKIMGSLKGVSRKYTREKAFFIYGDYIIITATIWLIAAWLFFAIWTSKRSLSLKCALTGTLFAATSAGNVATLMELDPDGDLVKDRETKWNETHV